MDKKGKILIAVLAVVAVAVPTGIFVLPMLVGDQIEGTEVTVISVDITEINENSLEFTTVFSISAPSDIEVSFDLKDMSAVYDGDRLGPLTITPSTFTIGDTEYSADCVLSIEDETAFGAFVLEYVEGSTVDMDIAGTVGFTGSLADLDDQPISKTVQLDGLNGLSPAIQGMDLIGATADNITFAMNVSLNNPGVTSLDISDILFEVRYDSSDVGNASLDGTLPIPLGESVFQINATLGENKDAIETLIGEYIMGNTISLDLGFSGNISTVESGSGMLLDFWVAVDVQGIEESLISVGDLDIGLTVSYSGIVYSLDVDADVTIHNPMPFAINITNFNGDIKHEGVLVSVVDVIADGALGYPQEIAAGSSMTDSISISPGISMSLGLQLLSAADPAYMDVVNGELDLEIGGFTVEIDNFAIENIPVSITDWGN